MSAFFALTAKFAVAIAVSYALFVAAVGLFKNFVIFPAPRASYKTAQMFLPLEGGGKIAALWLPAYNAKYAVIYSHGNREDIGTITDYLRILNQKGISVLTYDYVGYGQSKGSPSEKKLYAAADAAWNFLTMNVAMAPRNIGLMGYSLGSAAASHLAQKHQNARCLILCGGFSSGQNAILPLRLYPFEIMENARKLADNRIPSLILHGDCDITVPPRNARANFAALKNCRKRLVWFEGVGHSLARDAQNYFDEITAFVNNP